MKKNEQNKSNKMSTLWTKLSHSAWQKAVTVMAAVVLFCTVYALILPAATLTGEDADEAEGIYLEQEEDAAEEVAIEAEAEEDDEDLGSIEVEGEEAGSGEEAEIVEAEDGEDEEETTTIAEADETEATEVIESESGEGEGETTEASEGGEGSESGSESTGGSGSGSSESGSIGGGEVVIGGDDYVVIDPAEGVSIEDLIETPAEESSEAIEGESEAETEGETLEAAEGEIPAEELEGETEVVVADEQAEYFVGNLRYVKKKDYKINVAVTEEAEIPVGAKLKVHELKKGTDEYNEHLEQAKAEVLDGTNKIQFARFFDISFELDGEEIEPAADVDVTITYAKKVEIPEEGSKLAVHFTKDEGIEVLEATGAPETIIEAVERPEEEEVRNYAVANAGGAVEDNEDAKAAAKDEEKAAEEAAKEEAAADEAGMFEDDEEEGELYRFSFTQSSFSVVGTVVTTTLTGSVMTADDETYVITINAPAEAEIPDGAYIVASEITSSDDSFHDYYIEALLAADTEGKLTREAAEAEFAAKEESGEAFAAKFFDITICDAEGNKIQPTVPVSVDIELWDEMTVAKESQIKTVHFEEHEDGEEKAVLVKDAAPRTTAVDDEKIVDGVSFKAAGFSVFGIIEKKVITTEFLSHNGTKYEITVTYGPEANIPEGSTLEVSEIEDGSEEYVRARNAVLADKKAKDEFVDINDFNLAALDISIINPDGDEIEPEAAVKVDIKIKELPGVEDLDEVKDTLEVQHHVEAAEGVVIDKVFDGSIEGSYDMETNEEIIAAGEAVDPESVSDEDFVVESAVAEESEDELDLSFETEVFSTFTITWRNGGRTVSVHYVDESGNELDITNPATTHPNMNADSSSPAYLIYDIDGYEYSYTYRNSSTNRIAPQLTKNYNNRWQYLNTSGQGATELTNGDNIYVVYKKKATPTTGGTPEIDDISPEDWPQDPATPQFSKSSTNNGDGTNTVSLSINGGEKPFEESTKANVIVIMDVSGSMSRDMAGTRDWRGNYNTYGNNDPRQRLYIAKQAANSMANTLINGDIDGVKMALVAFSTTTETVQGFTDNYGTFTSAVNDLTPDGGTNWEQALSVANRMAVDSDAATFLVFVTDGDPTFRMSRGDVTNNGLSGDVYDDYYISDNVFGAGSSDNANRNFDFATEEVKSILANNKNFYAIGVSSDVEKVEDLVNEAGGGSAYSATDEEALEQAFKAITQSIKTTLGFGDVAITDGITELSNVEMKVMQEVDPDSFTYYKVTSSGQSQWDPTSEGAKLASYNSETGAVVWDLGENFQLEDGVTYMVTFRVWPSQEAYDLIADLNNGVKVYAAGQSNSISDDERAQVKELKAPTETEKGQYTLKTNTESVNATYSQTSSTGETVTVSGNTGITATYHEGTIQDMSLDSQQLTITKTFEDDLTAGEDRDTSITLVLKRKVNDEGQEFADYNAPGTSSPNIVLSDENDWTYSFYVAPGFIVDNEVLEKGYQFTVTEPDVDYHYELVEEVVNPMVVDGTLTLIGDTDANSKLTAINRVKSGIDIKKIVLDTDGETEIYPDTEFTITGHLLGPDGEAYTFNNAEWTRPDESSASGASAEWVAHQNDTGAYHKYDRTGKRIIYKGHFDNTGSISFTLKAGEYIRFINVPEDCTWEFTESDDGSSAGYGLASIEALTQHKTSPDGEFTPEGDEQPTTSESEKTAALATGVVGNKQYSVTYTNQRTTALPEVEILKVDADTNDPLENVEFTLHKDSTSGAVVSENGNGDPIAIKTDADGKYMIGTLPAGTYYMIESTHPEGYELDETPVIITVTAADGSYTVTATKDGEPVISGPTEGVYTVTVDNQHESGDLIIKKTVVSDLAADESKEFEFTVTLSDKTISGEYGDATFENGVATLKLKSGDVKNIAGLRTGIDYTVAETADDNFTTTSTGETGTIVKATEATEDQAAVTAATAEFTNTRKTGDLEVTKTVSSELTADANVEFEFTVTLDDNTISGEYGDMIFTAGVATFKLKDGENASASGLPQGVGYTVTETAADGFTTSKTGDKGTISATAKATAAFTNTREIGELEVSKTVVSDLATDADKTFSFVVTMTGANLNGTYGEMTFANGSANFTLKDGEKVTATGLPTGAGYTVIEATAEGFTTTKTGDTGTISKTKSTAAFTNTRQTGSFQITKTVVSDLAADKQKDFTFTVTLSDTTITGTYGDATFAGGVATITLKHDESATISGLPTTVKYTVVETEDTGFTTSKTGDTGTITAEATAVPTAAFTNTRKTGDLTVTKTVVSSTTADKQKEFDFTVTLSDTSINATYGEEKVQFTNGVATFKLKDGGSKVISGLPISVGYTVTEAEAAGFVTTKTGDTGSIAAEPSTAAFTNTRDEGGLIVSKTVVSDVTADKTKDFTFTVTLSDKTINETYNDVKFENGVATFTLKDGETKNITGLPKGITYTVEETEDADFETTMTGETGTIADQAATAAFTNTRKTGKLTISKTVESDLAADKELAFEFTITLTNGDQKIAGTYSGVTFNENGEGKISLKGGESKDIEGLPTGTSYTVAETEADDFTTTKSGDTGRISGQAATAAFTNTREVGDLEVTKTVKSDLAADKKQEFSFTVTLGDSTISKKYGDMEFTSGVATFTLADGGKASATGLPTGVSYTVVETAVDGFKTEKTGDTGSISKEKSTAAFTNTREVGELTVKKTVESDLTADANKKFEFTITLDDTSINGEYGKMTFTDGVATVELKGGEEASATGLPTTLGYTVVETAADGFTTEKTGDTGSISKTASTAEFTNTRDTGDLEVSKSVVSDLAADKTKAFDFTITLADNKIEGTYGDMSFTAGVATFTLKDGESKTAEGLPTTLKYTVEETAADGFTTTKTGDTGSIDTELSTAAFTNTRETGNLTVSKILVSALAADADQEFAFTVTLGDTGISGTYGDMTFTDGVATVTLKGGERKTATGLPTTVTYTVEETVVEGLTPSSTGATGSISKEAAATAEFTNTRETGDLTVKKSVVSKNEADKQKEFTFTVALSDTTISGTFGDMTFEEGKATVVLKDGESKTAKGLPTTVTYTVTEEKAEGFYTESKGTEGTITTTAASAEFTNTQYSAQIGLIKIGDGDKEKLLSNVKFGLYLDAKKSEKAKDATGVEVGEIITADGKATVGYLTPGTYYLAEEKTVEGYRLLKEPVEITITAKEDGTCTVKYTQADYSESNEGPTVTEDGLFELTINNTAGTELPSTGGVGTTIFYILGSILAAGAAILLFVRKRLGR